MAKKSVDTQNFITTLYKNLWFKLSEIDLDVSLIGKRVNINHLYGKISVEVKIIFIIRINETDKKMQI